MIDVSGRDARVREAGTSSEVGIILLDLVLGRAAHPDPARSLAAAIRDARARAERGPRARGLARAGAAAEGDRRSLTAIASVVGTEKDPQGLAGQVASLEAAGVVVLPSSAQAARAAALALRPELAGTLPGGVR